MPQIIVESGTTRRIVSYTHQSSFVDNDNLVDKSKNVFLLDKHIINNMREMNLLEAWFDILVDYCYNWLNGTKPVYGKNFIESKDAIVNNSDIFQDFIDSKLKITNNDTDKISKDIMRTVFLNMYPDKHLTTIQIMTALKDRKIQYNPNLRSSGNIRGCYYGVKFSMNNNQEEENDNLSNGVDQTDQSVDVYKELEDKYKDLENKYNALLAKQSKISVDYNNDDLDSNDVKITFDIFKKTTTTKPIEKEESVSIHEFCDGFDNVEEPKNLGTSIKKKQKKPILSKEEKIKLRECESQTLTNDKDVEECRKKLTHLLVL
jgi:hypothetical protein